MKAVALFSSGIDSPVAAYLMAKKGVEVIALHMDSRPHTDDAGVEKARGLAEKVGAKLRVFNNSRFHQEVRDNCNPKLHCILCKRHMYRVAERIAEREGADFIVTGESIGQVASQTVENLEVLDNAVKMPVIRPLIGFDKEETIRIARDIGTYSISSRKSAGCPFVPKAPATKSRIEDVLKEESKIDLDALVEQGASNAEVT
ncbi:MAG: hypothetical protein GF416_03125 [Candidatus Altiarchaeales archaeon]|nr:hypothetical protein [Candidatus Altiarchaeales archaeon]MBD3416112.1 hypothetical protein [Candidatus Altiarchaeales archaeon]